MQDQTRSAELIRYKPSIFPCCSNSSLFSLLCDTILHLVISPDPFFLLSSVCLKTNEEIFKHWTTLCSERNLIHWHIMTLYTRTDVTILCYNVTTLMLHIWMSFSDLIIMPNSLTCKKLKSGVLVEINSLPSKTTKISLYWKPFGIKQK